MPDDQQASPIMAALKKFKLAEANLAKPERLWTEIESLTPGGITFGSNAEYEDRSRSYTVVLAALPTIDGWKPEAEPPDFDDLAQSLLVATEVGEPSAHVSVERWTEAGGRSDRGQ